MIKATASLQQVALHAVGVQKTGVKTVSRSAVHCNSNADLQDIQCRI